MMGRSVRFALAVCAAVAAFAPALAGAQVQFGATVGLVGPTGTRRP
jgi:hypothetical protein